MRALSHWLLFAAAVAAWAVAMALSRSGGAVTLIVAGIAFFVLSIALTVLDRVRDRMPIGSPRSIGWLLVVLTASFVPLVSIAGVWGDESSLLVLPAVGGTYVSWIAAPWLCAVGPQPTWSAGRATPALLAWLGTVLNFALTMG